MTDDTKIPLNADGNPQRPYDERWPDGDDRGNMPLSVGERIFGWVMAILAFCLVGGVLLAAAFLAARAWL